MKEWDYLEALYSLIENTPPTDPSFKLLNRLTEKENYYSFQHYMFRAYFVLDVELNALVGLFVRRGYSDASADLLPELEKAKKRYKERPQ